MSYQLVWFKRDLRLHDHAPLHAAAAKGPVACLYIIEPELWAQPDYSAMQYGFLIESLRELHASLRALGSTLYILTGDTCEILDQIYKQAPFEGLYSHEETGNAYTFQRDKKVAAWCKAQKLKWHESGNSVLCVNSKIVTTGKMPGIYIPRNPAYRHQASSTSN